MSIPSPPGSASMGLRIVSGETGSLTGTPRGGWRAGLLRWGGFTLIELLVVLAIVALLLSIVVPRYTKSVDHAKEVALKENLKVMRTSIDRFEADKGRLPASLAELVNERYLRAIPPDPVTESSATWIEVAPEEAQVEGVADVRSGAQGVSRDGRPYSQW